MHVSCLLSAARLAKLLCAVAWIPILLGTALSVSADGPWEFTKLVDLSTPVPGLPGATFVSFGAPVIDGEQVFFYAWFNDGSLDKGIFARDPDGTLRRIIREGDASPDGPAYTSPRTYLSIDGSRLAFDDVYAVYGMTGAGNALNTIVRCNDIAYPVPDGGGVNFKSLGDGRAIDGTRIAFSAKDYDSRYGVYVRDGPEDALYAAANWNTQVPGALPAQNFSGRFYSVCADEGRIFFTGTGAEGAQGLYGHDGLALARVVDTETPVPGREAFTFDEIRYVSVDGQNLAFTANYPGGNGIYKRIGADLRKVLDHQTVPLEGPAPLTSLISVAIAGQFVVFSASAGYRNGGLYSDAGGIVHRMLSYTNRVLDDREITSFLLSMEGFDAGKAVFMASYLYEEDLPSNSAIWLAEFTGRLFLTPETGLFIRLR